MPIVARPFVVDPSVPGGLRIKLLLGIPVGVSKANARLSASLFACARTRSTAVALDARFESGPLSKSYPREIISLRKAHVNCIFYLITSPRDTEW